METTREPSLYNTRTMCNWIHFNHLKTGLVQFSNGYCTCSNYFTPNLVILHEVSVKQIKDEPVEKSISLLCDEGFTGQSHGQEKVNQDDDP